MIKVICDNCAEEVEEFILDIQFVPKEDRYAFSEGEVEEKQCHFCSIECGAEYLVKEAKKEE